MATKRKPYKKQEVKVVKQQPRKDSRSKRVNFDNERVSKYEKDSRKPNANDISWYAHNPELLKAAASIPFSSILGMDLMLYHQQSVPGIMRFGYSHNPYGGDGVALRQAAISTYSYLVHANSRNYSYTPADLMVLILAGAEIFSAIAHVTRAYGTAKYYAEQNLYIPDTLLAAMGFDASDFRSNLGQVWFQLNEWITRTSQLWIPNTMPIIARWFWMNTNVFTDADNIKGQIYLFVPRSFGMYAPTTDPNGGALTPVTGPSAGVLFDPTSQAYKWADWVKAINKMFDALLLDEDRGMIYGDILNAYGADKIYSMMPIDANYMVAPSYNAEVMTQIENCVAVDYLPVGIVQNQKDTEKLEPIVVPIATPGSSDSVKAGADQTPNQVILNFHQAQQPTPEQVMVATRLTVAKDSVQTFKQWDVQIGAATKFAMPQTSGTEVVNKIDIYKLNTKNGVTKPDITDELCMRVAPTGSGIEEGQATNLLTLQAFDWHPFMYKMSSFRSAAPDLAMGNVSRIDGDFDNYTTVDWTTIKKMHDCALFSLFGVPQM